MGNIFRAAEVVEIGVQIEKNGRDYYVALAGRTPSATAREIFSRLAGEEEKHIKIFEEIGRALKKTPPPESYAGEYGAYLRALAAEHIFVREGAGSEAAREAADDRDAVERGIGFEKDSIIFYLGMKRAVPPGDHAVIDRLIEEEQKHLGQLVELRKGL